MNKKLLSGLIILSCYMTCKPVFNNEISNSHYPDLQLAGEMKNVMQKGQLGPSIYLDSLSGKTSLYGLGPEAYLKGEILIKDGRAFVSRVVSDTSMLVQESFDLKAPFFVYSNVYEWDELNLPEQVKNIAELEKFIDDCTKAYKRPFAFKLAGRADKAKIHIQNLPDGSLVSSPEEAHQGQVDYNMKDEEVEIIGFFSTKHQGIFTHHDSFLHMHLINKDETKMGHLDELEIANMKLYLPKS